MKRYAYTIITMLMLLVASGACAGAAPYRVVELETPEGKNSYAAAINNKGDVVGWAGGRAVLWRDGKMIDLGTLGHQSSRAFDVNDRGQVAGVASTTPGCHNPSRGFIWENGSARDIGYLSRPPTEAWGINGKGQIAGMSFDDASNDRAVLWDPSEGMRDLGTLRHHTSVARAVNDNGQVVGQSAGHAFMWQDGEMKDLGVLDDMETSYALAINDKGQVVGISGNTGYYKKKQMTRACLWDSGKIVDLGTLGGEWSKARGVNNRGQIVGISGASGADIGREAAHAFIWENGRMTDLNTLIAPDSGWVLREATDINDAGQIVGEGDFEGRTRAFLLIPERTAGTPKADSSAAPRNDGSQP